MQGRYSVPDLLIGTYEVQAMKSGFRIAVRTGIALTVGGAPIGDLLMAIGQTHEVVNVSADVSQVETSSSAVSLR